MGLITSNPHVLANVHLGLNAQLVYVVIRVFFFCGKCV